MINWKLPSSPSYTVRRKSTPHGPYLLKVIPITMSVYSTDFNLTQLKCLNVTHNLYNLLYAGKWKVKARTSYIVK